MEANPETEVQIGRETRRMLARRASAEEKASLWGKLCAVYPDYDDYQKRTERDIPVVILEPV
jgi:proline iminopeptidase